MICPKLVAWLSEVCGVRTDLIGANILTVFKDVVKLVMTTRFNLFGHHLTGARYRMFPPGIAVDGAIVVESMATGINSASASTRTANDKAGRC